MIPLARPPVGPLRFRSPQPPEPWEAFLTDRVFRIPAIRVAEQQTHHDSHTWMYRFDWPTPAFNGLLSACHALEIPFAWNNLHQPRAAMFTENASAHSSIVDRMHAAWLAFAHSGDLTRVEGLPEWPQYDVKRRATTIFNDECGVINDPQAETCTLWDGVL